MDWGCWKVCEWQVFWGRRVMGCWNDWPCLAGWQLTEAVTAHPRRGHERNQKCRRKKQLFSPKLVFWRWKQIVFYFFLISQSSPWNRLSFSGKRGKRAKDLLEFWIDWYCTQPRKLESSDSLALLNITLITCSRKTGQQTETNPW